VCKRNTAGAREIGGERQREREEVRRKESNETKICGRCQGYRFEDTVSNERDSVRERGWESKNRERGRDRKSEVER